MIDMNELARFIGLPYEKYNCWDLFAKIQREICGIELPDLEVPKFIRQQRELLETHEEHSNWVEVAYPQQMDAVLMARLDSHKASHIGVYVPDNKVLHTTGSMGACLTDFESLELVLEMKVVQFFRHKSKIN